MKIDPEKKYTYAEVVEALKKGEMRIPVPVLTGMNGSKYALLPCTYKASEQDEWGYSEFILHNEKFTVPSLKTKDEGMWFQIGPLLKGLHLVEKDNDIPGFVRCLHAYERLYSPFNLGYKRTFIHESGLPLLGYSLRRELIDPNRFEYLDPFYDIPVAHRAEKPREGIPLIPISAMAGAFTGEQQVLEYECERYIVPAFGGADFLLSVKGVSMLPGLSNGDIVACKRLSMDNVFFEWNKVYVIDTVQGPLIKRLKPGSDKDHVLVVSDNTAYDPFELAISSIYHLALVIGVIRLE